MKQTKHFKRTAFNLSAKSMVSTLLLLIAMIVPQEAWAGACAYTPECASIEDMEVHLNGTNGNFNGSANNEVVASLKFNYWLDIFNYDGDNGYWDRDLTMKIDGQTLTFYSDYACTTKVSTDYSTVLQGVWGVFGDSNEDHTIGKNKSGSGNKAYFKTSSGLKGYINIYNYYAASNKWTTMKVEVFIYDLYGHKVSVCGTYKRSGKSDIAYDYVFYLGGCPRPKNVTTSRNTTTKQVTVSWQKETYSIPASDATGETRVKAYNVIDNGNWGVYRNDNYTTSIQTVGNTVTSAADNSASCSSSPYTYNVCYEPNATYGSNGTSLKGDVTHQRGVSGSSSITLNHVWGEASWKWEDDGHSATCTRVCTQCSQGDASKTSVTVTLNNGITAKQQVAPNCTTKGTTRYTATATVAGTKYTSTKDVVDIAALGHSYGAGAWSWGNDGHFATCTRTCSRDANHKSSTSVTLGNGITSAQQVAPKCTEMGTTRYTATATVEGTQYSATKDVVDIAALGHNILQTGYCQNTGCGADLRVTTSYRVPTYKTPGVASSGIASWQTVSDVKAIPLPSSTTPQTWYSQYYVVQSGQTVSLSKGAICAGNVHLIVEDGATLNINANAQNNAGIAVSGGSTSLTIYGQTENTGKLTSISGKYGAGIGGNSNSAGANITINGADVKAGSNEYYTTGLGGGYKKEGYNIIINGGNVTAQGYGAAGIGGGYLGEGHDIIINGGNVKAADNSSGYDGAGIGGGSEQNGYNITINDGHITAIGSGGGAGIGGGYTHCGYNITIAGGTIDARGGGSYADGIGNGRNPSGYYDTKKGYIKFGLKVGIMSGSTVIDNTYGDMFDVVHKKQNITTHIHDLVYNGNATCTTAGTMSAQCDQCNKTFEFEDPEHPSLGHNFDYKTLTASPVEDGLYAYACDNGCGTHTDDHIIKDFNGAGNHLELTKDGEGNYSTSEDITIEDDAAFVSPVNFTAASASYSRTMASQWGTLCLPFAMPIDVDEPYDFYELTSATSAELTMTKMTGTLPAGTPVLVRRNASESGISLEASNTTIVGATVAGSAVDGLQMTGTFEPISITSGYYLASDGLVYDAGLYYQEHGTGVSIGRFRAWFEGSLPSGARGLSLSIEDEETSSLDAIDALTSGKAMIFDLGGNLIDELQQGVNIVKYANGKSVKVIIK